MSITAKAAIALLFFSYGLRLSPVEAWHGVRQWRLHLLVRATTFLAFPLLGLAARGLVPSVLNLDLYNEGQPAAAGAGRCGHERGMAVVLVFTT